MRTEYSKEQSLLREVVGRALAECSPSTAVRDLMASASGYDREVWERLSADVGLTGIHLPEANGGSGCGAIELGIVTEAMGRHLYCGPFFASAVMAGSALLHADAAKRDSLLPGIASGSTIATLVLDDLGNPAGIGQRVRAGEGGRLSGTAAIVLDAHVADLLVVVAGSAGGLGLFLSEPRAPGVTIDSLQVLDPTRKLSRVTFDDAESEPVAELDDLALGRIWDQISSALAHEMIGGAQHLLESTVAYTKERYQFGRPIGSFQALKHRCADLLMELELARAVVHHAALCLDDGQVEPWAASMAKAMASDVYMSAARTAIQLRGGMGFTWEDDTHLWFKRAKSSEVFMGTPHMHRERMMTLLEETEVNA